MLAPNPPGRPTTLTDELQIAIIEATEDVILPTQVAALCGISHQKLSYWLKRGEEELNQDLSTPYAQLFANYKKTHAKEVKRLLERLDRCPDNYRALCWKLEKCFREDFGDESDEMRQLKYYVFNEVLPRLKKGDFNGWKSKEKVDSENAHEEGSAS